jgi:superfamily II DNA or RNA helicase
MGKQQLRRWQVEAFDNFIKNKKMIAEVATGCGKTLFAIYAIHSILQKFPKTRVLVVVPKIVIMKAWLQEFYNFFDISKLSMYYSQLKEYTQIMITTTASIKNIALDLFDVIILDEVHNCYSDKLIKIIKSKDWDFMLGLSATIYSSSHSHLRLEKFFNKNKYVYGIKEGLEDEILNKFNYINYEINLDEDTKSKYKNIEIDVNTTLASCGGFEAYKKLPQTDIRKSKLNKLFDVRNKLIFNYENKFDILLEICKQNKLKKIIIFNQYNLIGDKMVELLQSNNLDARIINSDIDEKSKVERLKAYENNEYNILITSKMFDEGYNLPSIDTVIIFSGDSSKRQITQRIGRALRLKDYPTNIYQIYCKDTFENKWANKRSELFKELSEKYEVIEC